jgi:chemotaxis methyl-accepting protein methylase
MEGSFDLIVFSEVLYYLTADDVTRVAQHSQRALQPGGVVLLVHYLGETDYPLHGDIAAELFIKRFGQAVSRQSREALYRIDVIDSSTEKL